MQDSLNNRYLALLEETKPSHLRYDEIEKLLTYPEISIDTAYYNRLILEKTSLKKANDLYLNLSTYMDLYIETQDVDLLSEINSYYMELKNLLDSTEIDESKSCEIQFISSEHFIISHIIDLYTKFLSDKKYNFSINETSKATSITINEFGLYSRFKKETGIHYVISNGKKFNFRILVLPNYETKNFKLDDKFIKIDRFHSSGAGGQNINKVETAIRLTHLPTGISVVCQNERSQIQNKNKAYKMLEQKVELYYQEIKEKHYNAIKKEALLSNKTIRSFDLDKKTIVDNIKNTTYKLDDIIKEL